MKCQDCNKEMTKAHGCTMSKVNDRDRMEFYTSPLSARCHDCGVKVNHFHHLGCDAERCPYCKGQLISCGCFKNLTPSK